MEKLSNKTKIIYGLGDFGSQFIWTFTSSYLAIFYTDVVGFAPVIVSAITFAARLLDSIDDPIYGMIAERTKSKYGRFRPYILYGSPLMALFCVLVFTSPEFGEGNGKIVWATVTYIMLGILYSIVNLNYGSLSSAMTLDSGERMELSYWRSIGANIGQVVLHAISMPMIVYFSAGVFGGDGIVNPKGYLCTAVVFAAVAMVSLLLVFRNSKEVVQGGSQGGKIPVKISLKTVFMNKPLICLFGMMTCYCISLAIHSGLLVYYVTYVVKRVDLVAPLMTLPNIFTLLVLFLTKNFVNKVDKKKMIIISFLGMSISTILLGLTNPKSIFWIVVFQVMWGASKIITPTLIGSVPECVDYAEDKFGMRCDGIAYSFISFAMKVGIALGAPIGILMLGSGYVANAEQSAETIANINFATNYLPVIFCILGMIPALLYPLNKKRAGTTDIRNDSL